MSLSFAVPALIGIALLGFLAGLLSFKIKTRWCPNCGVTLECPECSGAKGTTNPIRVRGPA